MKIPQIILSVALMIGVARVAAQAEEPLSISGVYPHLTMSNQERECGTGAVVPWQGQLWMITYAPHKPQGSSDKLYRVTPDYVQHIFEGSVGGTPANRMIHRESGQLLIGPYLIDEQKQVRVIAPTVMPGRLTGNARHLSDPKNKVYYATMEEGLYEVDVNTLAVKCLIQDGNAGSPGDAINSELPGYHGKGLYSGQGRLVYANNGERGPQVGVDPTLTSGALAEWFGEGDWQMVRRNQFTEVTGPGGINGSKNPDSDPIWSMGWDAKSLILALLEAGEWHYFRLPKGSHSYDGAHGWNTEWPRIREIGEGADLLATMHGTFWRFPASFSMANSAGIAPRSNYLKVIGDFCRWGDRVVFGCDDSAQAEFLNTRSFKAAHGAPKQSNSNLWFVEPEKLDHLGPVIGRGSVWLRDDLTAGAVSDAYLFSGYDHRQLHLHHESENAVTFAVEVDREGRNQWQPMGEFTVPAGEAVSHVFAESEADEGVWVRLKIDTAALGVTAHFQYRNDDARSEENSALFAGVATLEKPAATTGVMRSLSHDRLGLVAEAGDEIRYYEINEKMELVEVDDEPAAIDLARAVRQPEKSISVDAASVLLIEDGQRYRLPKNDAYAASTEQAEADAGDESGKTLADVLDQSLALGSKVSVSGTHQDYAAVNAVDGKLDDESARWIAPGKTPGWIEIDLGAKKRFSNLWVVSGWNKDAQFVASDFDVQIKNGDDWQTLAQGEVRGNHQIEFELQLAEAVTAQQVRIAAKNTGFMRIYEIAIFEQRPDIAAPSLQGFGPARICREAATERDLLNVHGTFYELPARNAQGMAKVRPIATHHLAVQDFCSHSGLLFFTGVDRDTHSDHIFRSADGNAAVWAGVIDDLWQLGKPRGEGGPWKASKVKAGEPSDAYLMTGYDRKSVSLTTTAAATVKLEVDVDGTGLWIPYREFSTSAGMPVEHDFPVGFSAYWVRATSDVATTATVTFRYD